MCDNKRMSSNILVAWPFGIMCVSDRRLVGLLSGTIRTNRLTKMTIFGCADAHGVIVYNGIGMDDEGQTPSEWLLDLAEKQHLFDLPLADVLDGIKADLEARLRGLRTTYGAEKARHTFVFTVWHRDESVLYGLSNYERVDSREEAKEGSETVVLSERRPTPAQRLRIIATGAHPRSADVPPIIEAIKAGELNRARALAVKAVKNVSYGKKKAKGSVGASCQWAFVGPNRDDVWSGLDVVGGAIAMETPNLINIGTKVPPMGDLFAFFGGPGMIVRDTCAGDERARAGSQYEIASKTTTFPEPRCGICGAPLPASHQFCEVCLYDKTLNRPAIHS